MSRSYFPDPEEKILLPSQPTIATDRFLAVMRGSADLFWVLSPTGKMDDISPSWLSFTGQQEDEARGNGWLDAVYATDRPILKAFFTQYIACGHPLEDAFHLRRNDGIYRLMRLRVFPVCTLAGTVCELVMSGADITVEHLNDIQTHLALETSGVGLWWHDLGTQQFKATQQWKKLFGLPPDAPVTFETFLALVHPEDRAQIEEGQTRARAEPGTHEIQPFRITRPDGSIRWITGRLQAFEDIPNQPCRLLGSSLDITEAKAAEEQISQILESITDAFLHLDLEWHITYANHQFEILMGFNRETLLGQSLWEVQPQLRGTPFEQHLHMAMKTQQTTYFEHFASHIQ
ncbi:MAG TPA: PAS domain S-box protein, partial [Ktedonobacteraceae bacterium]|nr:PAS domain S-box protein [Ktedonobacteraceae bacterium]